MISPFPRPSLRSVSRLGILVVLSALIAPSSVRAGSPHVWTLSSWTRALRSDPAQQLKAVALYAARNEWESFQIAVRGDEPSKVIGLRLTALAGAEGAEIPPSGLRLYRAHQLHVTRATERNESFKEDWYPDALIPFDVPDLEKKSPALRALPFDLPAGETHTFWIDIHVPESAKAGIYSGKAVVELGGGAAVEVPVELQVFQFTLPKLAALKTEFGAAAPRILDWYAGELKKGRARSVPDKAALHAQCARLTTENRFNSYPPPELIEIRPGPDGAFQLSEAQIAGWKSFLEACHVNALAVSPPQHYFKDPVKDRDSIHRYLRSWDRALEAIGRPDLLCYTYLIDEPNDREAYEFTRTWGRLIRESGSKVKVLVTEQTKTQDEAWGDLHGAVDIWVPLFSLFDPETAAARRALGERIWTYTALCQGKPTPWWHLDYPLFNYRIPAWMAWTYHMEGLLYWGGMSYWNAVVDPWTDPETYRPDEGSSAGEKAPVRKGPVFNGEGSLLYPGAPVGLEGPVPSMRLKAIRDGIEDFEYLTILESLGARTQAEGLVGSVVRGWYEWSREPESYFVVRRKLGCMANGLFGTGKTQGGAGPRR